MNIEQIQEQLIKLSKNELKTLFENIVLTKEKEELRNRLNFPIKQKFYMFSDENYNYCIGKTFGLTDDQLENYCRIGRQVEFDIEIDVEGNVEATHINGIALVNSVKM